MFDKIKSFFKYGFEINLEWLVKLKANLKSLFNKIKNKVGQDGLKHILVSYVLCTFICGILFCSLVATGLKCILAASISTLFIGCIKELIDLAIPNHTAEIKDIICDVIGIGLAVCCCLLFV